MQPLLSRLGCSGKEPMALLAENPSRDRGGSYSKGQSAPDDLSLSLGFQMPFRPSAGYSNSVWQQPGGSFSSERENRSEAFQGLSTIENLPTLTLGVERDSGVAKNTSYLSKSREEQSRINSAIGGRDEKDVGRNFESDPLERTVTSAFKNLGQNGYDGASLGTTSYGGNFFLDLRNAEKRPDVEALGGSGKVKQEPNHSSFEDKQRLAFSKPFLSVEAGAGKHHGREKDPLLALHQAGVAAHKQTDALLQHIDLMRTQLAEQSSNGILGLLVQQKSAQVADSVACTAISLLESCRRYFALIADEVGRQQAMAAPGAQLSSLADLSAAAALLGGGSVGSEAAAKVALGQVSAAEEEARRFHHHHQFGGVDFCQAGHLLSSAGAAATVLPAVMRPDAAAVAAAAIANAASANAAAAERAQVTRATEMLVRGRAEVDEGQLALEALRASNLCGPGSVSAPVPLSGSPDFNMSGSDMFSQMLVQQGKVGTARFRKAAPAASSFADAFRHHGNSNNDDSPTARFPGSAAASLHSGPGGASFANPFGENLHVDSRGRGGGSGGGGGGGVGGVGGGGGGDILRRVRNFSPSRLADFLDLGLPCPSPPTPSHNSLEAALLSPRQVAPPGSRSEKDAKGAGKQRAKDRRGIDGVKPVSKRQRIKEQQVAEPTAVEDPWEWRKYGQKLIKDSPLVRSARPPPPKTLPLALVRLAALWGLSPLSLPFLYPVAIVAVELARRGGITVALPSCPRSYLRCSQKDVQQCPAKKMVNHAPFDSTAIHVKFMGEHNHLPPTPILRRTNSAAHQSPPAHLEGRTGGDADADPYPDPMETREEAAAAMAASAAAKMRLPSSDKEDDLSKPVSASAIPQRGAASPGGSSGGGRGSDPVEREGGPSTQPLPNRGGDQSLPGDSGQGQGQQQRQSSENSEEQEEGSDKEKEGREGGSSYRTNGGSPQVSGNSGVEEGVN
eukprot:jgi/Mesen1/2264/ME000153S01477